MEKESVHTGFFSLAINYFGMGDSDVAQRKRSREPEAELPANMLIHTNQPNSSEGGSRGRSRGEGQP